MIDRFLTDHAAFCFVLNVSPQIHILEIRFPMYSIRSCSLTSCLGHENSAFTNELMLPEKERACSSLSHTCTTRIPSSRACALMLDLPVSRCEERLSHHSESSHVWHIVIPIQSGLSHLLHSYSKHNQLNFSPTFCTLRL